MFWFLFFFCTIVAVGLCISKCIFVSEEEAGSTWLLWVERKRIVSGNFSLCFIMERVIFPV